MMSCHFSVSAGFLGQSPDHREGCINLLHLLLHKPPFVQHWILQVDSWQSRVSHCHLQGTCLHQFWRPRIVAVRHTPYSLTSNLL